MTGGSNFLRRHYPDQVQGDPKLRFVSISAEDAPQRPCFYVQTYYTRPPLIVKPFKFYPHDSPQVSHAFFNVLSSVPGILQLYSQNTQTGVIDRKKKRILCGAMAAAMTVSGYSATVDDSGASVSDSFSEYEAAKS